MASFVYELKSLLGGEKADQIVLPASLKSSKFFYYLLTTAALFYWSLLGILMPAKCRSDVQLKQASNFDSFASKCFHDYDSGHFAETIYWLPLYIMIVCLIVYFAEMLGNWSVKYLLSKTNFDSTIAFLNQLKSQLPLAKLKDRQSNGDNVNDAIESCADAFYAVNEEFVNSKWPKVFHSIAYVLLKVISFCLIYFALRFWNNIFGQDHFAYTTNAFTSLNLTSNSSKFPSVIDCYFGNEVGIQLTCEVPISKSLNVLSIIVSGSLIVLLTVEVAAFVKSIVEFSLLIYQVNSNVSTSRISQRLSVDGALLVFVLESNIGIYLTRQFLIKLQDKLPLIQLPAEDLPLGGVNA